LTLSQNIPILCGDFIVWRINLAELDNQGNWTLLRSLALFAFPLAITMPSALTLAGVAPDSRASSTSQSGAKVGLAKPPAGDRNEPRENGKESAK